MEILRASFLLVLFVAAQVANGKLLWSEEFDWINPNRWQAKQTSAYEFGNQNPNWHKLDYIDPDRVWAENGNAVFQAVAADFNLKNGARAWRTGLLSTEGTKENIMVRPGQYIETRVQLPSALYGSWPALWTWKGSGNEIDTFEWHPNRQDTLELSNHVNENTWVYVNGTEVQPGKWITIGTHYGALSVSWYVNGRMVRNDMRGVGFNWSANLIINLSVSNGDFGHPAPKPGDVLEFKVDYIRVYDRIPGL